MFILCWTRSAENTVALLPRHLLCQRQKPTSIYMKAMASTSKSALHLLPCVFDTIHLLPGTWQQVWQITQVLAGGRQRWRSREWDAVNVPQGHATGSSKLIPGKHDITCLQHCLLSALHRHHCNLYICMQYMYMYMYLFVYVYNYVYVNVYVYVYVYVYVCCTYIHVYIVHTCTYVCGHHQRLCSDKPRTCPMST